MCLIFLKEKKQKPLTKAWCKEVWDRNSDGWGMTYVTPKDGLVVLKGLVFEDFWRLFNDLQQKKIEVLVHMRMATQGLVNVANLHPFEIGSTGIYLMHNGVVSYPREDDDGYNFLYGYATKSYYSNSDESDTRLFVDRFLTPLLSAVSDPQAYIRTESFQWMMDEVGGRGNRFALSDNLGHVIVGNGTWSKTTKGMLVSNTYAFTTDKAVPKYGYNSSFPPGDARKVG